MTAQQNSAPRPHALLRWPTYPLGQLYRIARARLDAALEAEGHSTRGHFVLVCLAEHGELSQQQVSDRIAIDRSDMVKLIDKLEDAGLLTRRRDAHDRRRYLLSLTPSGHRALEQGERIIEQVTNEVLAKLSIDERTTLHRLTLRALGESTDIAP